MLDSINMIIILTPEKKEKVKAICTQKAKQSDVKAVDLAQPIGILVSSLPGVQFGRLYYRQLEIEKNLALKAMQAVAIFRLCFPSYLKRYQNLRGGSIMLIKLSIQYPMETQTFKLKLMHLNLAREFILVTTHPRVYGPLLRANYT